MFSKKATKNDENFTVDLAFLEKISFDSILCYQDKVRVSFHEKKSSVQNLERPDKKNRAGSRQPRGVRRQRASRATRATAAVLPRAPAAAHYRHSGKGAQHLE